MRVLPVLLGLLVAPSATSRANNTWRSKPNTHEGITPVVPSSISHMQRDSSCTASHFYGADEPSDMCGPTTFTSLTRDHCDIGDASLVDDCNGLIADLQGLHGGGYWGMVQEGILVIASHGTCTFHIERRDKSHEFAIGTQDMIDIISSAIAESGVVQECRGQKMMVVTGLMSCEYKGTTVDTIWWIEGPDENCS